ncbi:hypothetical protein AOY35_12305 [Enterococcus faecium]|uniref:hypothetical protein n=1 Tax=Enterococcus faecium TaxID=1352 RepID=UPI00071C06D6|nr:hypothetical protein [Enterococcus faecium]KST47122.1 hypothetical protein AOY35_12305 [Enterococcus faecium]
MANFERLAEKYGDPYISTDELQQLLLLVYNCGNADSDINGLSWMILYKEMEEFEKIFKYSGTDVPEELQTTSHSLQNGYPLFDQFKVEKIKARKGNKISSLKIYFKEHRMHVSLHNWLES